MRQGRLPPPPQVQAVSVCEGRGRAASLATPPVALGSTPSPVPWWRVCVRSAPCPAPA